MVATLRYRAELDQAYEARWDTYLPPAIIWEARRSSHNILNIHAVNDSNTHLTDLESVILPVKLTAYFYDDGRIRTYSEQLYEL